MQENGFFYVGTTTAAVIQYYTQYNITTYSVPYILYTCII